MATDKIQINEGTAGKYTGTYSFTEDAVTKNIGRVTLNTSAGVEVAPLTDTQLRATAVPVSVSGVATAAKQPALGTAGTSSADVITVQGIASGTALPTIQTGSAASSGESTHDLLATATTNATNVKASAGAYSYISLSNSDTVGYWFKMYNKASAPTVGTDTPVSRRYIPAGGGREIAPPIPIYYSTGISYAITLNATDADTTAVTNANKVSVLMRYI